jgi:mono/diheme cytochrome c family protein
MNTNKQINIMIVLVFLSVFATGAYTLWDPRRGENAESAQHERVLDRGAFLFAQNCRTCHGDAGEGGAASNRMRIAPPLNRPDLQGRESAGGEVSDAARSQAYDLVFNTIVCGRVGKAMPTWGQDQGGTLNNEQIRQLTEFIVDGGAWERAEEFAIFGVPEFDHAGDISDGITLSEGIGEDDTTVRLSRVDVLGDGSRIQIDREIMVVEDVEAEASSVVVERGFGTTNPGEHEAGVPVLRIPIPPDPEATVAAACGQIAGAAGPTPTPAPPSASLEIVAQGIAWDRTLLTAFANQPLTIRVDHRDPGQIHNWALYEGEEPGGELIVATELENGPVIQNLEFGPLDPGSYYYNCEVHPQMEGVLTAVVEGAPATDAPAADATADVPAADETPAPSP